MAEADALRAELIVKRAAAGTSKGVGLVDRLMGREHARGSLEEIESRIAEADAATAQLRSDRELAVVGFKEEMSEQHDISLSVDQARSLLFPVTM